MQREQRTGATARWLWTRKTYYQAEEAGLFGPEERLELIEGQVLRKASPQSVPHAICIGIAAQAMRHKFSKDLFHIREGKPVVLNDLTEPEPDVVVVAEPLTQSSRHPTPANIALCMEVSISTLHFDQTRKAALYAHAGIADYWILNMPAHQLEVRRDPGLLDNGEYGYRSVQIIAASDQVFPLAAPSAVINVADMLPLIKKSDIPNGTEADTSIG